MAPFHAKAGPSASSTSVVGYSFMNAERYASSCDADVSGMRFEPSAPYETGITVTFSRCDCVSSRLVAWVDAAGFAPCAVD
jgi:hypothetical protein